MDLVILAGGMGSRFGGLKQIEPIDNNGNFIIDYSIFDAIRVGFEKVVVIIKKENLNDFKNTLGKRLEQKVKVEYAFQELNSFVPEGFNFSRSKPWGTAHAVLCAKGYVKDKFAIINADDFYGGGAYAKVFNCLKELKNDNGFLMVAYKVKNTLTENGEVKRGICEIKDGNLVSLVESAIKEDGEKIVAKPVLENCEYKEIDENTLVSMNLFGFTTKLFDFLENEFKIFLKENANNLSTCEFFIPNALTKYIKLGLGKLKVYSTDDKWFGLTYRQDFENVCKGINNLVKKGEYPVSLWD